MLLQMGLIAQAVVNLLTSATVTTGRPPVVEAARAFKRLDNFDVVVAGAVGNSGRQLGRLRGSLRLPAVPAGRKLLASLLERADVAPIRSAG